MSEAQIARCQCCGQEMHPTDYVERLRTENAAKDETIATLREALKTHGEEAAKLQSQFDAMCALIEIRDRREEREKRFGIASAPKPK